MTATLAFVSTFHGKLPASTRETVDGLSVSLILFTMISLNASFAREVVAQMRGRVDFPAALRVRQLG